MTGDRNAVAAGRVSALPRSLAFGALASILLLAAADAASAELTRAGAELQVNTYTSDRQYAPAVAMSDDGRFVVVWESRRQDGDYYGIFARRYDAAGMPLAVELQINSLTADHQRPPT